MIFTILSFALMPFSIENADDGELRIWEGKAHSETHSVAVIGTTKGHALGAGIQNAIAKITRHKPLTEDDIIRQRLIAKYGLEKVQQLENGTLPTVEVLVLDNSLGQPQAPQTHLVTISDVAKLGIDGGSVSLQPSRGWAYVNKPLYLQSDTSPVTKTTTILGTTVTITATPVSYTWRCGDGHSFTTKDAGGTWPNGTVTHSYTRSGTYTLSADITWRASYTVNGNTYPVDGTLTTTSTVQTIKIVEAEAVLKN